VKRQSHSETQNPAEYAGRKPIHAVPRTSRALGKRTTARSVLYDGWNVIAEYAVTSTTETLIRERTWGTDLSGTLQGAGGVGGLLLVEEIGTTTSAYHFQYDGNGNVTEITDYTGAKAATYQFDLIGNRLKTADSLTLPVANNYTPNALNQYTAIDTLNPVHDDDGNMTAGPLPANITANSTLTWDGENRLISATVPGGNTVTFIYDSQSRRIAETVGTVTKITVYDGWNPVAEWTADLQSASSPTLTKTNLWGMDLSGTLQGAGGVGGLLMVSEISNSQISNYYPTYDGNGNVSEYLDSTGAVVAHYEYDPFGKTTVASGSKAQDFSHRFSTKPLDLTTGLYYYAYRYYDPQTGRWPSRDPIEEEGGINLYGFVENDGINWYDVSGLQRGPAPRPSPRPRPGGGGSSNGQRWGHCPTIGPYYRWKDNSGYFVPSPRGDLYFRGNPPCERAPSRPSRPSRPNNDTEPLPSLPNIGPRPLPGYTPTPVTPPQSEPELSPSPSPSLSPPFAPPSDSANPFDGFQFFFHYRKDDISGQNLWQGSHVTTSFFTRSSEARLATGAASCLWRCTVGGPSRAFKELAMTPGYATDYEVTESGLVFVYTCTKLEE
jgi:RHS repeat-associated protein